jgi:hypothetical protein
MWQIMYLKVRLAFFFFFSSTNVETKNVCPIAYNMKISEVEARKSVKYLRPEVKERIIFEYKQLFKL